MAEYDFDGPASLVNDMYLRSISLADFAKTQMATFMDSLRQNMAAPDSISVEWAALAQPAIVPLPTMRAVDPIIFVKPGGQPSALDATLGPVNIDDFDVAAPVLPVRAIPEVNFGTVPVVAEVRDVAVPTAPVITLPTAPQFLSLSTHTFGGVNLHEDWLDKLKTIPEMSIPVPAKLNYTPGGRYGSPVLTKLQEVVNTRLYGGTGLPSTVEQQLFDIARDRESKIAQGRIDEVARTSESLGFPLPSGVLVGMGADAHREYTAALSTVSREITVTQANLEQQNLRETITMAMQLESQLMDYSYKLETLVFEAAKAIADNEIAVFNGLIQQYTALLTGYKAYADAYDSIIKAELSKVEVFKALLSAEELKTQINKALVDQYKAEIEGRLAVVEVFKAQVSAAQTLVELERTRVQISGEQIRAFVASTSAELSKVELVKAQLSADGMTVENFRVQAQAYTAKISGQAERARVEIAQLQAKVAAKELEWTGWKSLVAAEQARVQAIASQSAVVVDGHKVSLTAIQAQADLSARMWEGKVKEYDAIKTLTLNTAKINRDTIQAHNASKLDAAKVGAQVGSQQLASAFNAVSTSASISGSTSLTQVIDS